ncbi:phage tail assembly chaperone [Celeribacter indicus]|uniref:Uncharacterized protein n=1 Tax=Celeribacter indicus TaxID=1208324 RepID=A0A0B5E4C7_9RHOB|nr:hypothetical protein [Celeribacter indicus]AJE47192.1 hypothetical protein P73_2477 [Celeribacter indicus]SDW00384.1 hypothetical protein SAMN05443573_10125 [Celeribacter indicus]
MRLRKHLCNALEAALYRRSFTIPAGGEPIWEAFLRLSRARRHHAAGPEAISHQEILAYCRCCRIPFAPHHIEAIEAMDEVWLEWTRKPKDQKTETLPLTAALFDFSFG